MASKSSSKGSHGPPVKSDLLPEVALAAIVSAKKQNDVAEFLDFFVNSLERNSDWMNGVVEKQADFRCALLVGAGPNRFQLQEIIYPAENGQFKLEVELKDCDDFDKIAIAALLKISNRNMNQALEFVKSRLYQNPRLRDDLMKGKSMGVTYAVLKPFADKQYRLMDRITIDSSKAIVEKKRESKSPILKRFRRF